MENELEKQGTKITSINQSNPSSLARSENEFLNPNSSSQRESDDEDQIVSAASHVTHVPVGAVINESAFDSDRQNGSIESSTKHKSTTKSMKSRKRSTKKLVQKERLQDKFMKVLSPGALP